MPRHITRRTRQPCVAQHLPAPPGAIIDAFAMPMLFTPDAVAMPMRYAAASHRKEGAAPAHGQKMAQPLCAGRRQHI